jgi:hypothetical protein
VKVQRFATYPLPKLLSESQNHLQTKELSTEPLAAEFDRKSNNHKYQGKRYLLWDFLHIFAEANALKQIRL